MALDDYLEMLQYLQDEPQNLDLKTESLISHSAQW